MTFGWANSFMTKNWIGSQIRRLFDKAVKLKNGVCTLGREHESGLEIIRAKSIFWFLFHLSLEM